MMQQPEEASVHVHLLTAAADEAIERRARPLLDPAERRRAARYLRAADRGAFLAGRLLLRRILEAYLNLPAADLTLYCTAYGRPALDPAAGSSGLRFNLSHSRGLVCLAVTRSGPIGVDIEARRELGERRHYLTKWFDAEARTRIASLRPEDRDAAALIEWTRLEASLKLGGRGLSGLRPGKRGDSSAIHFTALDCGDGHVGSLATCHRPSRIMTAWWRAHDFPLDDASPVFAGQQTFHIAS